MSYGLFTRDERGEYAPATAAQILEVARQVADDLVDRPMKFTDPAKVGHYLIAKLGALPYEVFAVLFLDNQHRLIDYREIFRGTLDSCAVYPREVVKEALFLNAGALILAHNHPSGVPEPSHADRNITDRLQQAMTLIDVRVIDHVVVGGGTFVSFAERGLI